MSSSRLFQESGSVEQWTRVRHLRCACAHQAASCEVNNVADSRTRPRHLAGGSARLDVRYKRCEYTTQYAACCSYAVRTLRELSNCSAVPGAR